MGIEEVLATGDVHSVLQPIVELDSGLVVAYEALARGPAGTLLHSPDVLFAAARAIGRVADLDQLCRRAALYAGLAHGVVVPLTIFVNVEPEVVDAAPLDDLLAISRRAPGQLRVVLEITERALAARPAELLQTVERVRELGWHIALDDVGSEDLSLAFMPLLRPEVVKLDLRLVQQRPGRAVAEIMNAVNAYAERRGAVVLAEGIETEEHLALARGLGARLGQGWMFGRPVAGRSDALPHGELTLPRIPVNDWSHQSPFECLPAGVPLRRSSKPLLIEVSKHLEREALRLGTTAVVAAAFQHARHFTPSTVRRYAELAEHNAFVAALGEGLAPEPVTGVRGATLAPSDPLRGEWDIVVLSPHFAAALLARELPPEPGAAVAVADADRMFEFALTYDRNTVIAATSALLGRVAPRLPGAATGVEGLLPGTASAPVVGSAGPRPAAVASGPGSALDTASDQLLSRALSATSNGVSIADYTRPDHPLVYVNAAFERLSGSSSSQVLGANCRFLQGPDTDPEAVRRISAALRDGRECRETLRNYRGPARTPWWNEIYLAPVHDAAGRLTQYIGVQNDVTARVEAEQALRAERDRAERYAGQIEELAFTDPLTGLLNRRRVAEVLDRLLWETRAGNDALALLYLDLNGFKAVNDSLGHAAGDEVLRAVADRAAGRLRRNDSLARLGGDEFLVVLPGLDPAHAAAQAGQVAAQVAAAIAEPIPTHRGAVTLHASVGVSLFPGDGEDFDSLLRAADSRMYAAKAARIG